MATTAAIRLRHGRPVAALDLRESDNSTVIGDALSVVLTAASISWKQRKQHGFCALPEPIRLRRWSNDPIVPHPKTGNKIRKTRRKRDAILTHDFRQRDRDLSA